MLRKILKRKLYFYVSLKAKKIMTKMIAFILALFLFLTSIQFQNFVLVFANNETKSTNVNRKSDMSKIPIDYEIIEKRDQFTKYFRKLDGSYEVSIYNEPVHYLNNGKWEQINNSLILDEENNEYSNNLNSYKIKLPKKIDDNKKFKLVYDKYQIDWNILNINSSDIEIVEGTQAKSNNLREVENVNKSVIYKNILENVDLEYIVKGNEVKENFILNQYIENFSITFELSVKDLTLITEKDNIYFIDENGNRIFDLGTLVMYDSKLNYSDNITYTVEQTKTDTYNLTIIPDNNWLISSDVVYPIKIDPTFYIKNEDSNTPIKDTYASYHHYTSALSNINTTYLKVGYNNNIEYRSFLEFDLLDIIEKPIITYALLGLSANSINCDSTCQISLKEVSNVDSNTTIESDAFTSASIRLNNNLESYYGKNINIDTFDYELFNNGDSLEYYSQWDMTRLVQKWVDEKYERGIVQLSNPGFDEVGTGLVIFNSSETNVKPFLEVGFVDSVGLVDAWTYHNQDAGLAGVGYTNDYTGNLTFIHVDSAPIGGDFSFGISHVFDNGYKDVNIGYGEGWRINYNEKVELADIGNGVSKYRFVNGDGSTVYFDDVDCNSLPEEPDNVSVRYNDLTPQSCSIAEDGSGEILRYYTISDYDVYSLASPSGLFKEVIYSNTLKKQYINYVDTNNNDFFTVNFIYGTDRIAYITDYKGNLANFYYDNGLLNRIEIFRRDINNEPTLYQVSIYVYDSSLKLINIIDVPKDEISLEYKKQANNGTLSSTISDWIIEENSSIGDDLTKYIIYQTKYDNEYVQKIANRSWKDLQPGDENYEAPQYSTTVPTAEDYYRWVTTGVSYTEYLYKKQWYDPYNSSSWMIEASNLLGYSMSTSDVIGTNEKWDIKSYGTEYNYYKKYGYHTDKVCLGIFKEAGFLGVDTQIGTPCYWVDTTPTTSDDADLWENKYLYYDESLTSGNYLYTGNGFNYNGYYVKMDSSVSKGEYYVKWTSTYADNSSYQNLGHKITSDSGYGWYTTSTIPANSHTSSSEYFTEYYYDSSKKSTFQDMYGNNQTSYYRYKVTYDYYIKVYTGLWKDLQPGDTNYEAPKYAQTTPSASSGYRWISTGTSRTYNQYKKQVDSIDSWSDKIAYAVYEFSSGLCSPGDAIDFDEVGNKYCIHPYVVTQIIENSADEIYIDPNNKWVKINDTERTWNKYKIYTYGTWHDLTVGETNYEAPVISQTGTPQASVGYQWVLTNNNDFSDIETISSFTYDENDRLYTAQAKSDVGIRYSYNNLGKVEYIEEYIEGKVSSSFHIDYYFHETLFTNFKDQRYLYVFDNFGHTINVFDDEGNATYYFYDNIFEDTDTPSNWNLNNKVRGNTSTENIRSTNIAGYIESRPNLLLNPDFEELIGNEWKYRIDDNFYNPNQYYYSDLKYEEVYIGENNIYNDIVGDYLITVSGEPTHKKGIYQEIIKSGATGDSYIVGGFVRGFITGENDNLIIKVSLSNGINILESYVFDFNSDVIDGQYLTDSFVATVDYDKIIFEVIYQGDNTISFDNFRIYNGEVKTEYKYKEAALEEPNTDYSEKTGNISEVNMPNTEGTITYNYEDQNPYYVTSVTNEKDVTSNIHYDHSNDLKQIDEVSSNLANNNIKSSFDYDDNNNITGTVIGSQSGTWFSTSTTYIANGLYAQTVTNEYGSTVTNDYDVVTGLLDKIIAPNGVITSNEYDSYGRLVEIRKEYNNGTLSINKYKYVNGLLDEIEVNGYLYKFNYDEFGKLTSVYVANIKIMSYEYEQIDKDADGSYEYYTDKLLKQVYGNKDYIEFKYTSDDKIEFIKFNGETRYSYVYDSQGRLFKYIDEFNGQTYIYRYDSLGRLEKIEDLYGNSVSYGYNNNNEFESVTYNLDSFVRTTRYLYQNDDIYDKTEIGSSIVKDYIYKTNDNLNRLDKIALNTGATTINESFIYDDSSVVTGNAATRVKTVTYNELNGLSYTYSYDELGNITEVIVKQNSTQIEKYNYYYDKLNQLIREDVNILGTDTTKDFTMIYNYDNFGNILSKGKYSYQYSSTTTNDNAKSNLTGTPTITSYEYYNNYLDQLYNFNGKIISYDDSGNPTKIKQDDNNYVDLTWDGRQLASYTVYENGNIKQTITYKYNDQGIRTYKKVATTSTNYKEYNYYLDGNKVIYEKITYVTNNVVQKTDKIYYSYDFDGKVISFNYNGTEYFYIRDNQDNIVKIVDVNGAEEVKYTYDAWGNIIDQTSSELANINPYRYRGYRYDSETSLYYLNSRYYSPEMGRFINPDAVAGGVGDILGHNLYAYVMNNPVMRVDDNGYWPKWAKSVCKIAANVAVGIVVGAAVGAITACTGGLGTVAAVAIGGAIEGILTNGIENAIDGKPFFEGAGKAAAIGAVSSVVGFGIGKGVAKAFGRACFAAGTLVKTKYGDKAIEDIKVGDLVYAEDPDTGEKGLKKVVRTFVHEKKEIVHIKVNGEEITTTDEHPFYVPEKGWTVAAELRAGDQLKLLNGEIVIIEQIQHELLENPIFVYNFEVEDFHTYYVSESGILVHNACSAVTKGVNKGAAKTESLTNEQLANKVAKKYGGTVRIADNGKGYVVKTNNITTRIMDSGGGRTNYYKISNQGKGAIDRFGNYTSDLSKNHIDIGPNSYDEITNIIDKFIKR